MDDDPTGVNEVIEPSSVATHLDNVGVVASVVFDRDFRLWPAQVHTRDEAAVHPHLELWDRPWQTSFEDGHADLGLRR